jgi:hypothetical protein
MYVDQALKAPDKREFLKAMQKEVEAHTEKKHWELVLRSDVPEGTRVLPAVWAMKRKRRITTREVYKWKARLNIHGGKQEYGVNYWETYAATLSWPPIRFLMTLSILRGWHTRQLDFTMAYPQADIEVPLYMDIPKGFTCNGSKRTHCLKLLKNLYGQKQAGRTWHLHLRQGMLDLGFVQSEVDDCIFYRGDVIFMVYVDDAIFMGPDASAIDKCIEDMKTFFTMQDEGDISDYLGIKVSKLPNGTIKLAQPQLIDSILHNLNYAENTKSKPTPAPSSVILQRDLDGAAFDEHWDYRSAIGKLNFLEKSTRPDIAYAVHQCARFAANPRKSHAHAIQHICRYLAGTRDKGIILDPKEEDFSVFVDSDFCGTWNRATAGSDAMTAKSRSGHVITYAGCPISWSSKMQTEVALSTTEAEYIACSTALRDAIPLMNLTNEVRQRYDDKIQSQPTVRCEVFEDNSGALELAMKPKMRPRTKHINVKFHHFRDYVRRKLITILPIRSEDNPADTLTKPLPLDIFLQHRLTIQGW